MADLNDLYSQHLATVLSEVEVALDRSAKAEEPFGGVVFHSGAELLVHRDDQPHLFRRDFHFARLAPLPGADHLAVVRPGHKPKLIRIVPEDYWYEAPAPAPVDLEGAFEYLEVPSVEDAITALEDTESCAFVGDDPEVAEALGIEEEGMEPDTLMASLDWSRAFKTEFEAECVRRAAKLAGKGHAAVRDAVASLASERQLHHAYLAAANLIDDEIPYPNIIGWDANAAILHYQSKSTTAPSPGQVLLIDAGASYLGYACDITRTWVTDAAPQSFRGLLDGMDVLQRELVAGVKDGAAYIDLHAQTHLGIAKLLTVSGILRCSAEEAIAKKLTWPFMPHGLGHHLGLQVHDVGGKQIDPEGNELESPPEHPFLRTTRPLAAGHVVTIEPGLYFIPMLLDPVRVGEHKDLVDWNLVDSLIPLGGIRIEDDILVTKGAPVDLTRGEIPGHRGS